MEYEEISEDYDIDTFEVHLLEKENSKATEALCSTLNLSEKQAREILKMRLESFAEMEKAKLRHKACVVKRTYHLKLKQLKSEEA